MQLSEEQKTALVTAIKGYKKSLLRVETANKDLQESLNKLKTCSQGSGSGEQILSQAMTLLGHAYMEVLDKE
jgi:hypothetical protein